MIASRASAHRAILLAMAAGACTPGPLAAQIARKTRVPPQEWLARFMAAPEGDDFKLGWAAFPCPAIDPHHDAVLRAFLAKTFPDRVLPAVGQGMELILSQCQEPRAARWLEARAREKAPTNTRLATELLRKLWHDRSPEHAAFLVDLIRSGISARTVRRPQSPMDDYGLSDFEDLVITQLKGSTSPERLSEIYFDFLGTGLLSRHGQTSFIPFLRAQRGDAFLDDYAAAFEARPILIRDEMVVYDVGQMLVDRRGKAQPGAGAMRLARALIKLRDRVPDAVPVDSRRHLNRVQRAFFPDPGR
jgi:hypothetical protein